MLPLFCTVLWTPTKRATPDTSAVRPISAAGRLEQREASYACVVLYQRLFSEVSDHSTQVAWHVAEQSLSLYSIYTLLK